MSTIPVMIVGAGPVGLTLALDLAWHGIRSVVIEREAGTGIELLAKAGGINERSLEFCRRWGIRDAVVNWGKPEGHARDTIFCTSLDGHYIGRSVSFREPTPASPEQWTKCPQYIFDPIVARAALATGRVEIRYGTRFERLTQDQSAVTVHLTDLATGRAYEETAAYLAACDGAGSGIREALGIPFEGKFLDYSLSVMLHIEDLARHTAFGPAERYMFIGPGGTWANITNVDFKDYWRFVMVGSEERLNPDTIDLRAELRRAFGSDDVGYQVRRLVPWRRSQCAAQRYRVGRVLLAGDAAHTTSPTGAHGLNTGLGDVFGLGWMLAASLRGWAGPHLLDAYEAERRPVAIRNSTASTRNYRGWIGELDFSMVMAGGEAGDLARRKLGDDLQRVLYPEWHSLGVAMGYRYEGSPIVFPDGSSEPDDPVTSYSPTGRPGHRAPHAWLSDGRSTLDLFGHGFTLMDFAADGGAARIAAAARAHGLPMSVQTVADDEIRAAYGADCVLVRPDGHVCWRGRARDFDQAVFDVVTGRVHPVGRAAQRA